MKLPIFISILVSAVASCTSSKTARNLAGSTMAEIAAYEQELENKINAEEGFYATQSLKLAELEGALALPEPAKVRKNSVEAAHTIAENKAAEEGATEDARKEEATAKKALDEFQTTEEAPADATLRRSLMYLRIAHSSDGDAMALTDDILAQGVPKARSAIKKYLEDGIVEDSAAIEKAVKARQLLQYDLMKNLAALDAGKKRLEEARAALLKVREKKSTIGWLKDTAAFGKDVRAKMKENEKKPAS